MLPPVVIAEPFVWAHLPKTGGDATREMLCAVPGLVRFADPPDSNDKHMPFFGREQEIAGKQRVMNIRRLPAWTLSGAHHKSVHGVYPDYAQQPLETPEEMTSTSEADDLLRWMTDHGRLGVERWLRAESLREDLLGLLDELGLLNGDARTAVLAVGRVNEGSYDRGDVGGFTHEQIRRLYELNPTWAEIERRVYGGVWSPRVARERPHLDG